MTNNKQITKTKNSKFISFLLKFVIAKRKPPPLAVVGEGVGKGIRVNPFLLLPGAILSSYRLRRWYLTYLCFVI